MEPGNTTNNIVTIKVDTTLDKYENYPLPDYKTESARRNLASAKEVYKKLRETQNAEKLKKSSKENI